MTEFESLLDLAFDLAADLMCILDTEGCCRRANQAFERVLGYANDDICNKPLADLLHPSDQSEVRQTIKQLATEQRSDSFTHRYRCKTGRWRWLSWNLSVIDAAAEPSAAEPSAAGNSKRWLYYVARDVTCDKSAEADAKVSHNVLENQVAQQRMQLTTAQDDYLKLLETERATHQRAEKASAETQLYAEVVQNMQVGLYIWRLEDWENAHSLKMVSTNPAASQLTGLPTQGVVGRLIGEIFPALLDTDIPEIYANVVRTQQPYDLGEVPYEDDRVSLGIFAVQAFPLADSCMGISFENITERKQANLALKKQTDDLLAVNRLLTDTMAKLEQRNQELDQFAYVTSHDLKAPLRAIANLATWIEEDLGDRLPPENIEQFDLLKNRVHRMEGLINGLLAYSRVGRNQQHQERVDVGELLEAIVDSISPLGQFLVEIAPDMPVIRTQKVPLHQVFANLLSNAIKHHDRPDGKVQVQVHEREKAYEFVVADDGPGIDVAYHQKIFTIFQTLRARDDLESTGIGLSIVKKTVEAKGGKVSLTSSVGKGSTFRFTWPKSSQKD